MNVAFLVFNRPDLTARVFAEIRRARPERLFVLADGPRKDHPDDAEKVLGVRSVVEQVDWPCQVERNYSDVNLGCRRRVSSGLDWVFERVENAIILEDDCLPHKAFFSFCTELLERYADDDRVYHITGFCPTRASWRGKTSYCVSHYAIPWGWASWRRAWKFADMEMRNWPTCRDSGRHRTMFGTRKEVKYFEWMWDAAHQGHLDTWDVQWCLSVLMQGGMVLRPAVNLIRNLGFREDATHTTDPSQGPAECGVETLEFPLIHPSSLVWEKKLDRRLFDALGGRRPALVRRLVCAAVNPYVYGSFMRSIPFLGRLWAQWRGECNRGRAG